MYETFYGLDGKPFQLSPDPRFFFESRGHSRALAYLNYGVEEGDGFVVVTGDVGTGKTTLARILHDDLKSSTKVVIGRVVVTQCTGNELLRMIAQAFAIPQEKHSKPTLLKHFEAFLWEQHEAGRRTLLLLDEVQNLPMEALEMLRMLSNFHNDEQPLLQSLLLGQAEFKDVLNGAGAEQLRQRVIAWCHLHPFMSVTETQAYVEHRLTQVGWNGDPSFEEAAFRIIHDYTDGFPRRINTFCDRLLLFAYLEELHAITGDTVDAVATEISGDFPARDRPRAGPRADHHESGDGDDAGRVSDLEERVGRLETALRSLHDSLHRTLPEPGRADAGGAGGHEGGAATRTNGVYTEGKA